LNATIAVVDQALQSLPLPVMDGLLQRIQGQIGEK
jgi:hypothetical protein